MHAFLRSTILGIAAAALASVAHAGDDPPKANDLTLGFNAAPQSLYWYGEIDHALNGDIDKTGFLLRSYASLAAYDYTNPLTNLGEIDGVLYQFDVMAGYQVVRDGLTLSGSVGFDYQNAKLTPNDPTTQVNGTQTGIKFATDVEYDDDKQPWMGSISAEYSTAYDTYYAQARLGLRLGKKLVVGPEVEADGDTGYNGQSVGGWAKYTFDVTKTESYDVTLAAGHQFVDGSGSSGASSGFAGSSGTYGSVELNTSF